MRRIWKLFATAKEVLVFLLVASAVIIWLAGDSQGKWWSVAFHQLEDAHLWISGLCFVIVLVLVGAAMVLHGRLLKSWVICVVKQVKRWLK